MIYFRMNNLFHHLDERSKHELGNEEKETREDKGVEN